MLLKVCAMAADGRMYVHGGTKRTYHPHVALLSEGGSTQPRTAAKI